VEQRFVALAADDPLAARSSLSLADLAGRVLPDGSPAETDGRHPPGATRTGVLNAREGALDLAQILSLIEVGSIVWFPPASLVRRHQRAGIAYRPVSDLAPETLCVAWPRHSHSPAVAAFARVAVDTAAAPAKNELPTVHGASPALEAADDLQIPAG
jgi:LysR substrate binding domain-containing protein